MHDRDRIPAGTAGGTSHARWSTASTRQSPRVRYLDFGAHSGNPPETTQITPATNGISAQVGPMKLEDMLILSYGSDQPGRVLGAVFNSSSKNATVTISGASGSQATIRVTANGQTLLKSPPAVTLNPAGVPPDPWSVSG